MYERTSELSFAPRDSYAHPRGRTHRKVELVHISSIKKLDLFNNNNNKKSTYCKQSTFLSYTFLYSFFFFLLVTPFYKGKNENPESLKSLPQSHPNQCLKGSFSVFLVTCLLSFFPSSIDSFVQSVPHLMFGLREISIKC